MKQRWPHIVRHGKLYNWNSPLKMRVQRARTRTMATVLAEGEKSGKYSHNLSHKIIFELGDMDPSFKQKINVELRW